MSDKRKGKAEENLETICPSCGNERPEGDAVYECVDCGLEGFDCCVAGRNALCESCATKREKGA